MLTSSPVSPRQGSPVPRELGVFSVFLKLSALSDGSRRSSGAFGPATKNSQRLSMLRRCRGTTRWWQLEDLSHWRLAMFDVGWQQFTTLKTSPVPRELLPPHIKHCQSSVTSIFQPPPSCRTTTSSQHAQLLGILRRRSECAWRPPRPVAQCRQFQEDAKDASVSECTWTLSALEALRNALYKFKTYLLTFNRRRNGQTTQCVHLPVCAGGVRKIHG